MYNCRNCENMIVTKIYEGSKRVIGSGICNVTGNKKCLADGCTINYERRLSSLNYKEETNGSKVS